MSIRSFQVKSELLGHTHQDACSCPYFETADPGSSVRWSILYKLQVDVTELELWERHCHFQGFN